LPSSFLLSTTHLIIISPGHGCPKSTLTRYRKPDTSSNDPSSKPQDFFSIKAVYLASERESGLAVGFVNVTERKSVVDWLEGRIPEHERIVFLTGE
jgi:parafibromin